MAAVVSTLLGVAAASLGSARATPPMSAATACQPTDKLVNPCRPWLGVYAHGYPPRRDNPHLGSDLASQIADHEQRIKRRGGASSAAATSCEASITSEMST